MQKNEIQKTILIVSKKKKILRSKIKWGGAGFIHWKQQSMA
jgi:hypothetical protein